MAGISKPESLCIRIARDFPGVAKGLGPHLGSTLILGPPGVGKTTLLRDLIRNYTSFIAVIDEKEEIYPIFQNTPVFSHNGNVHVMTHTTKEEGIQAVLRNMGASAIAVDEITKETDCNALMDAGWCGVTLLATAHASGIEDLYSRKIYKPLASSGLFQTFVILDRNKCWQIQRACVCT